MRENMVVRMLIIIVILGWNGVVLGDFFGFGELGNGWELLEGGW